MGADHVIIAAPRSAITAVEIAILVVGLVVGVLALVKAWQAIRDYDKPGRM
jgi:hypothetical protein